MWHEARKREKATQKLFNEHKKRAEKRREENRINPNSLLQVHGLKSKLCLDSHIYKQATNSLVAWQGDKSVMIDRFDVRATLTSLPSSSGTKPGTSVLDLEESEPMRKLLNYERYRLVVQNDLNKVPEELRLKLVSGSDALSDAKMKKLSYNKFGTSGDASLNTNTTIQPTQGFGSRQPRKSTAIGFDYSSVPPPPSLLAIDKNTNKNPINEETPTSSAARILDLYEYDNLDNLDSISISHHLTGSKLDEVIPKYGLSKDEFITIAKRDSEDVATKDCLEDLRRLNGAEARAGRGIARLAVEQVYGPTLPPDLTGIQGPNLPSLSSGGSSPIQQRSPSGAINLPTRCSQSPASPSSAPSPTPSPSPSPSPSPAQPNRADLGPRREAAEIKYPGTSQQRVGLSPRANLDESRATPVNAHEHCERSSRDGTIRRNSTEVATGAALPPRRAATPLAYKRNRRSSRSVSRERRRMEAGDLDNYHCHRSRSRSRTRTRSRSPARRRRARPRRRRRNRRQRRRSRSRSSRSS